MNKASCKAYEYLSRDEVVTNLITEWLKQGTPIVDVAIALRRYVEGFSDERKQEIYRQLYFSAIDATTWGDVANFLYYDHLNILDEVSFNTQAENLDEIN